MPAAAAGLRGRVPPVHADEQCPVPGAFLLQDPDEVSPAVIRQTLPKTEGFFHVCKVYILYPYDVILPHKAYRHLVQEVVTLVLGFRMQLCDLPALLPVV